MENFYKPGRVIITHMTPEELEADRAALMKSLKKYPWRRSKRAVMNIEEHIVDGVRKMKGGPQTCKKVMCEYGRQKTPIILALQKPSPNVLPAYVVSTAQ